MFPKISEVVLLRHLALGLSGCTMLYLETKSKLRDNRLAHFGSCLSEKQGYQVLISLTDWIVILTF